MEWILLVPVAIALGAVGLMLITPMVVALLILIEKMIQK